MNGDDQRVAGHPDERDKDRTGYEPERKAVRGGDPPPSGDDGCRPRETLIWSTHVTSGRRNDRWEAIPGVNSPVGRDKRGGSGLN